MVINDKILTLATGAMLAVGGAAASLFLGDHNEEPGYQPDLTVVAALEMPALPAPKNPIASTVVSDVFVHNAPDMPQTLEAGSREKPALVFAAIEPSAVIQSARTGSDLIEVAVVAGVPELALPAEIENIVLTRAAPATPQAHMPRYSAGIPNQKVDLARNVIIPTTPAVSCEFDVRATPIFGARVSLKLNAPCHPNVAVTIRHGGLQFKERLDNSGVLMLKVPAFAEYARFEIELADGTQKTVGAYIAGMSSIERVGIAWTGDNDTFLHAFQKGAKTGETNHIWRLNARDFATARAVGGGYMTVLGEADLKNPSFVQVYTLPKNKTNAGQFVSLGIETLRGDNACGQDMALKIARHSTISGASASTLSLSLPECGAVDTSLVLKNVLKDMKVARK